MNKLNIVAKENYWLIIEPYVQIFIKPKISLIYNTLNGKYIEAYNDSRVYKILKRLASKNYMYAMKLSSKDFADSELKEFVDKLKEYFMGDLLNTAWSGKKPFQMKPMFKLSSKIDKTERYPKINGYNYLSELVIFLNSGMSNLKIDNRQFIFPNEDMNIANEINYNLLKKTIEEINGITIHVSGNNIFKYSKLGSLLEQFKKNSNEYIFYVYYNNSGINLQNIQKLAKINAQIHFSVSGEKDIESLLRVKQIVENANIRHTFNFKVESVFDFDLAEQIVAELNIQMYSMLPFYNGRNLEFFKENIFNDKIDIFEAKPSENDFFARKHLNQLNFGKLFISPNGEIYSNLNTSSIGSVLKGNIYDLIQQELKSGKNWRRLRMNVKPCRSCIYNLICPSLSNLEYVIGKNNLCNITTGYRVIS